MPRDQCKIAVRLVGLLVVGVSLSDAWHALHTLFFNRIWFGGPDLGWLWPFSTYDPGAMDELGKLLQFGVGVVMVVFAGWVSRVVVWRGRAEGECPKCGYDVRGVTGKCPECGAGLGSAN